MKSRAVSRLRATAHLQTALVSSSPVDDGVAEALAQNMKFSESLRKALEAFDKDWCVKEPLTDEAETFVKKHGGAKTEDIINQCTATVGCFLKYVEVPEGTIDNVSLDNSTDDSGGKMAITEKEADEGIDGHNLMDEAEEDESDEDDEDDEDEEK